MLFNRACNAFSDFMRFSKYSKVCFPKVKSLLLLLSISLLLVIVQVVPKIKTSSIFAFLHGSSIGVTRGSTAGVREDVGYRYAAHHKIIK